jgi:hypothetical protein
MGDVSVAVALKVTWSEVVGFAGEWLTLTVGGVVSVTVNDLPPVAGSLPVFPNESLAVA